MKRYLAMAVMAAAIAGSERIAAQSPVPTLQPSLAKPAIPRRDVVFTAGWLNGNKSELSGEGSNDWYNGGFYGGATAGWYWTDHVKTEVEVGTTNTPELYTYRPLTVGNVQNFVASEFSFRTTRLAVGQQIQFYRNAWFHPHLTGGVDLLWETTTEHVDAIFTFDQVTRTTRQVRPEEDRGPDTRFHVRPFAEGGFKAYMTPKTFFRTDLRLTFHDGVDQALVRFGFGVDF
jgi:hypothetical protein